MAKIRLTKEFKFEMAHALLGYDGACSNIHGHSYFLNVTIMGIPLNDSNSPKDGMVMDYTLLKKIVNDSIVKELDHALLLNSATSRDHLIHLQEMYKNVVIVPFQPTCENLLLDFAKRLKNLLPNYVTLHSLKLSETVTSFAEWFAEDN